jgi:predicted enzyme related to lactoylglutathione lyase
VGFVNVLPSLHVADFEANISWYERLFDREPDRRPMDGDVEWQLAPSGGLQLYRNPDGAVATTVILGVDDLKAQLAELSRRGLTAEPYEVGPGRYLLAELHDPAGNTIILSQTLS